MAMKKRKKTIEVHTYTLLDEMFASPVEPLNVTKRTHQLTRMYEGLRALETAPDPSTDDWRVCSDAVNMIETLVNMGEVEDSSGLLNDAIAALAMAGKRHMTVGVIRLDAPGIKAVRSVLEDYAIVIETLSARTMIHAHRQTEKRIHEILRGKMKPHDIEICS